ncbi:MAG TPA: hypothetical protein VL651_15600 [Bacteroidia bacterium]|jgi:hypothetical protein|nr:hypothetical protein [Bacteroidia bacterium]
MKKLLLTSLTFILALTFVPTAMKASSGLIRTEVVADTTVTKEALLKRLNELEGLDRSTMNRHEKKATSHEANAIRKTLHSDYGGIYISLGGLLLIIILLIIFL